MRLKKMILLLNNKNKNFFRNNEIHREAPRVTRVNQVPQQTQLRLKTLPVNSKLRNSKPNPLPQPRSLTSEVRVLVSIRPRLPSHFRSQSHPENLAERKLNKGPCRAELRSMITRQMKRARVFLNLSPRLGLKTSACASQIGRSTSRV